MGNSQVNLKLEATPGFPDNHNDATPAQRLSLLLMSTIKNKSLSCTVNKSIHTYEDGTTSEAEPLIPPSSLPPRPSPRNPTDN